MNPRIPIHQRFSITRHQMLNQLTGPISSDTMRLTTPFSNANIEYNINVFPNGRSPAENGRFLVFLQFKFTNNFRLTASYTFIVGGSQQRSFDHCYKTSSSFGGILCPRQLIFYPNCMLVQDRLNIELRGHVAIQNFPVYTISPHTSISPLVVNTSSVRRLPAAPSSKIVQKEKSTAVVETSKQSETEANIARILQQHLEEERRTSIYGGGNEAPGKEKRRSSKNVDRLPKVVRSSPEKAAPVVVVLEDDDAPKETSTKNENSTPSAATVISKEVDQTKAAAATTKEEYEMNATDISSDTLDASNIHEPLPLSEPSKTPKTNEPESHQTTASSTPSTEEPNGNKRVRTRTVRYGQFFVNADDDDAPATKRSRKRRRDVSNADNASNENEEYLPPSRRSKSSARISDPQKEEEKIEYDCKIEGAKKVFDVNKKILAQKSNGFALLFETNTVSNTFELEGIPDETLEAAFNFCHGIPLKEDMNTKEYNSILFFAKTFEIPELKSFCEDRLAEKTSSTNSSPNANPPVATKLKPQKLQKNYNNYLIDNVRNLN